jgi:hypothetical protein
LLLAEIEYLAKSAEGKVRDFTPQGKIYASRSFAAMNSPDVLRLVNAGLQGMPPQAPT